MKHMKARDELLKDFGNLSSRMDQKVDSEEKPGQHDSASEYSQPASNLPTQVSQRQILAESQALSHNIGPATTTESDK
jgi:hypothetical protein